MSPPPDFPPDASPPVSRSRGLLPELLATALPGALGPLDAATLAELSRRVEWVTLEPGEAPFRQGDAADAWYVVASGRLQIVAADAAGRETVVGELGRGDGLGEVGLLGEGTRTATPYALRPTVLIRFSAALFEEIIARHPRALLSISRTLVRRWRGAVEAGGRRPSCVNLAIVPAHPGVPIADFTRRLVEALRRQGASLHVGSVDAPEDGGAPLFSEWLDERAASHRFVVLEGDAAATPWTRRALGVADHVLLVADARRSPAPDPLERAVLGGSAGPRHAQRTLILLHPPGTSLPRGTARWLDGRDVQRHLHVRQDLPADLDRVARALSGSAVSLVLGAGGARGFAHVGVLRALAEGGVPVDHVGGTSIGALVGAMFAMGRTPDEMMDAARRAAALRPFAELTLPVTSLLVGRRFERIAALLFGDVAIEDLWLPFFCTSCDLSTFREVVHERGNLAEAALASSALPGVLPPRIRAGHLHVDGGTSDVLPAARMRERSRGRLIAVDVSTERDLYYPAERYPTSLRALWERLRPGGLPTPSLPELFMRAASFRLAERTAAVASDADLFLRPPVERFGTAQVEAMEVIAMLGYADARKRLEGFGAPGH